MNATTLNVKYCQAISEVKQHLTLSETIKQNKIPNDNLTLRYLTNTIKNTEAIEYPTNYFTKENLFNSNYNDLVTRDFEKYFYLSELLGFKDSGKDMLKRILNDNGKIETPILIKGRNEIYYQLSGNLEMIAFKVLGLFPIVRVIRIDAIIIP